MVRIWWQAMAAAALVLLAAGDAWAQGSWPDYPITPEYRGTGFYLSGFKIFLTWIVFLLWARSTDWISTDVQEVKKLDWKRWIPVVVGTFFVSFVLIWLVPVFWAVFPLEFLAWAVPLTVYIVVRNKAVSSDQRVMTREHIRWWVADKLSRVGFKVKVEARDPREKGAKVILTAAGGPTQPEEQKRLLIARNTEGFLEARRMVEGGLSRRASAIRLDYNQQNVEVNYLVDGVWHKGEPITREAGDPALASLKLLAGGKPEDRQARQEGKFAAQLESEKYKATILSQGVPTGERVVLQFEGKEIKFTSLEDVGMREKMEEQLREVLARAQGLFLFAAPPASGLRTTTNLALRTCDRFLRDFASLEEESNRYEPIENVNLTTYKQDGPEDVTVVLRRVFRSDPNAVVVRDLVNAELVGMMCEEAIDAERMLVGTIRAVDCADALVRVLAMGVPREQLAEAINGVLGQRLVRKLCETCKEAYKPAPQVLQQLGIPEGKIEAFYRPHQPNPELKEVPCPACSGIGYIGRTAVLELLIAGDNVRAVLKKNPTPELLRKAARADGMRSMLEEGIVLVAKGVTSLPELMRVLKQ